MEFLETPSLCEEFHRAVTVMIARADKALSVAEAIGDFSESVNRSKYRELFGHVQLTETDEVVLCLGKLFDPPPKRYPTRSIRSILAYLECHAASQPICARGGIEAFLADMGRGAEEIAAMNDEEITTAFVHEYRKRLENVGGDSVGAVLERIRFRRDKEVAHNEAVGPADRLQASWTDLTLLLAEAKAFAGIVGPAYLNYPFLDADGSYTLTGTDKEAGRKMRDVLTELRLQVKPGTPP